MESTPRGSNEDEKDAVAAGAEIFGDAHCRFGRAPAHHRAFVAGRDDRHGLLHRPADRVFQELANLAAATRASAAAGDAALSVAAEAAARACPLRHAMPRRPGTGAAQRPPLGR